MVKMKHKKTGEDGARVAHITLTRSNRQIPLATYHDSPALALSRFLAHSYSLCVVPSAHSAGITTFLIMLRPCCIIASPCAAPLQRRARAFFRRDSIVSMTVRVCSVQRAGARQLFYVKTRADSPQLCGGV